MYPVHQSSKEGISQLDFRSDEEIRSCDFGCIWSEKYLQTMYGYNKTVTSYSFGLGESSLDHHRREEFPAISIL